MNKDLHGNLECKTPVLLVNNGCGKQGRGVLGLLLLAFSALFLGGEAWADDPLVDGGVYLIKSKKWNDYYLYPRDGDMKVEMGLEPSRYWCVTKVGEDNGDALYTFRSYDVTVLGVGSSSKGVYAVSSLPSNPAENVIKYSSFDPNNEAFRFKLMDYNGSYFVIPFIHQTQHYSWFINGTDKKLGVKDYNTATNNNRNQFLWDFIQVETISFGLADVSISGQMLVSETGTYHYTRGTSKCFLYFDSYMYSEVLDDNTSTNYTTYDMDVEGTPLSGITCTHTNDTWTLEVTTLPTPGKTITLKCTVTRHLVNGTVVQQEFRYPIVFIGQPQTISSLSQISDPNGYYILEGNIEDARGQHPTIQNFAGLFDGQHHTIKELDEPIFGTMTNAVVRNVNLENVIINTPNSDNTGAIANVADGASRIYNVGILSGSVGGSGNTGGLVGLLDGTARVINCFSFANITSGGQNGTYVGGLVGNNSQISNQTDLRTIVVNCMFYGDIDVDHCSNFAPVYGNNAIKNDNGDGINPYCFFSEKDGTFSQVYLGTEYDINSYNRSWPVAEQYLTRFEYYRSIFNSNRQLMAWWVSGNVNDTALISKWVLDPSIASYPILKKWGKYPSIINPDTVRVWDTASGDWKQRTAVGPYQGKKLGTLSVKVLPGSHAVSGMASKDITLTITDMDTLNYDYCYYKVQLPYYNEMFGNRNSTDHDTRYGGNYTDSVVTGWKITSVTRMNPDNDTVCFEGPWDATGRVRYRKNTKAWESGFNFADRKCTSKDLYVTSGRVFAQGGYYYVPDSVTAITIEAYWGKAIYMRNLGNNVDLVNLTNHPANGDVKEGKPFVPAGTLPTNFQQDYQVYTDWREAVKGLSGVTAANLSTLTVYDQAIVLVGNFQLRNENGKVGTDISGLGNNKYRPYTIMSVDLDLDNEPDYCFEFQFRNLWERPPIQPIRFDFLTVPELGMAVRHNEQMNTIGIFVPQGHFEITETSYMHTTQFEYDAKVSKVEAPVILNGGHFEQIVIRYGSNVSNNGVANKTSYILMGGHFRMLRFTPGAHTNRNSGSARVRLCAVNAIGGEYPEFYLSGIYRPDIDPAAASPAFGLEGQGNPHCYTNGGRFGIMAGAGYDKILGSVTFKIDHSIIREFYGGGINGANPVGGSIDVTIDHSIVQEKYCGGPKVGPMTTGETVTTHATGTRFKWFYGGGNGGTTYYRDQGYDGNDYDIPSPSDSAGWASGLGGKAKFKQFNPLNTRTVTASNAVPNVYYDSIGYHALYEFECFVSSNGLAEHPTLRTYTHWAQFGTTRTGNVTNELDSCIIEKNFYGGGNLGNVDGWINSTISNSTIMGNVFGGGFSGKIEPFSIHNKAAVKFPYLDKAGVMQNGLNGTNSLYYLQDNGINREYTWCYKSDEGEMFPKGVNIPPDANTLTKATFMDNGKWYVLTKKPLNDLGAVSNDVTLILKGSTKVGTMTESGGGQTLMPDTGNVYGGGDESAVNGSANVIIWDKTHVYGNVYGGGNRGKVVGKSSVTIEDEPTPPQP